MTNLEKGEGVKKSWFWVDVLSGWPLIRTFEKSFIRSILFIRSMFFIIRFKFFQCTFYLIHTFPYLIQKFYSYFLFDPCFSLFNSKISLMLFIRSISFLIWFKIFIHTFYSIHIFLYLIQNFHSCFLFNPLFFLIDSKKSKKLFIQSMMIIR